MQTNCNSRKVTDLRVLTALARVREAAHLVQGDGERRVRLHGDGAVGHGARAEALHDLARGLDGVQGDRLAAY